MWLCSEIISSILNSDDCLKFQLVQQTWAIFWLNNLILFYMYLCYLRFIHPSVSIRLSESSSPSHNGSQYGPTFAYRSIRGDRTTAGHDVLLTVEARESKETSK